METANKLDFKLLKTAVAANFEKMQRHQMFRARVEKDELWANYLAAFPEGTNPLFRARTEHDCGCCKQFIRAVGDCVAIINGKVHTIWDVRIDEPAYQTVADAMSKLVKSRTIQDTFLHYEPKAGTDKNFEEIMGRTQTWNHFFVNIKPNFVMQKALIPTKLNDLRTAHDVFRRALSEIDIETIDIVLELISQNSLYRGEEHKFVLGEFRKAMKAHEALLTDTDEEAFIWNAVTELPPAVTRIGNSVIGTLLYDISEGKDLEEAVKAFEFKVAPANYKRPTALVTKAMIEKAKLKIEELGLTSALERRFATIHDITINNILFANCASRSVINSSVFDELAATTSGRVSSKTLDKVEEVPIAKFLTDILPKADSLEVMFENGQAGNLVSLIAPVDPTAGQLFKWPNAFSWSYNGEVADAIKERVKQAGGNVTGDLCCRLAWSNKDDLDLHMQEPGAHIYFGSRLSHRTDGQLDVDMNNGFGGSLVNDPVENIFYPSRNKMAEGTYTLFVNQYRKRDSHDVGFTVQIDFLGTLYTFAYDKAVRDGENVIVARFKYSHKNGVEILESLPMSSSQKTRVVWGLPTQTFHKVNVLMMSPNYWDEKTVGNKHYFFMLDGCVNDGTARGFYNEFLKSELDTHRKVFEMVGSKMKPVDSEHQLSGLGFSSTQKSTLVCRVKGSFSRTIKIVF